MAKLCLFRTQVEYSKSQILIGFMIRLHSVKKSQIQMKKFNPKLCFEVRDDVIMIGKSQKRQEIQHEHRYHYLTYAVTRHPTQCINTCYR